MTLEATLGELLIVVASANGLWAISLWDIRIKHESSCQ